MDIHSWLSNSTTKSEDKRYRHRLLKENREQRDKIISELKQYFYMAHEDVRQELIGGLKQFYMAHENVQQELKRLASDSLDPLGDSIRDLSKGYPEDLPLTTLKGYFGEVMVALFIEKFAPFGNNWELPVFLFRHHEQAFDYLEELRQGGDEKEVFGRTGNDCLAFQRNENNEVTHVLFCEAKCTADHDSKLITEAHEKVSTGKILDIRRIIKILQEKKDDSNSQQWVSSLQKFYFLLLPLKNYQRYDLVSYVCGQSPKQKNRTTWIDTNQPHKEYTGNRPLEAVEIHLHNVDELIKEVYGKQS